MQLAWIKIHIHSGRSFKGKKKIRYRTTSSYFLLKLDPQILFIFNLKYYANLDMGNGESRFVRKSHILYPYL